MKNAIIILVGPSGAGKSTFLDQALKDYSILYDVITCTTRAQRKGESEGNPYFFLSREKFLELIEKDYFIEWAEVHGNLYGVPEEQLHKAWAEGKAVIMDIDIQGAQTLRSKYPQSLCIFITPPSLDALRDRVIRREGQVPKDLELRMENAKKEMAMADQFDFQVVNADFQQCYREIKKIIDDSLGLS
ncbi:MAG: guanylate kinase [Bdellovibrionales bacterium]|nr:guanylate kinase [Bdellovibrionales bacterium]